MPVTVQWDDEAKTIIICTVNAKFSVHGEMAETLRNVVTLSNTVEHQVGNIMDWTGFQPSIPDNTVIYPKLDDGRTILRRDFGSSAGIMDSTIDYWNGYAANTKQGAPPHKITIFVLVFDALPTILTVWTGQTKFTTASYLDEAREMIHAHFQGGKAD
jgi:hypothetical protein